MTFSLLLLLPAPVSAFDELSPTENPPAVQQYHFDQNFSWSQLWQDRIEDAATEWNNRTQGTISFSSSGTNLVTLAFISATANGACTLPTCILTYNHTYAFCDRLYSGTGISTGVSQQPLSECSGQDGFEREDLWGTTTHEFGHWKGLGHEAGVADCNTSDASHYASRPDRDLLTMCYNRLLPGVQNTSGAAGRDDQRTITQDEIQGVENEQDNMMQANRVLNECPTTAGLPRYWNGTPTDNRWCSGGVVALNDNSTYPYPELFQVVRGGDADRDNNGRFAIRAVVRALEDDVVPRAVLFVRHPDGSNEDSCDSGALPLNQWKTINCGFGGSGDLGPVDLVNSTIREFEYGVRVTNKIEITIVEIRDL